MPRAFVTDLDRTLLRTGGAATASARRALREVRAMGLPTLLVSGRPYEDLVRLARPFGEWDALVAEDGAVVEAPTGRPPWTRGRRTAATVRGRVRASPRLHPEFGRVVASVPLAERIALRRAVRGLAVVLVSNVDRVMVIPRGLSKGSGVATALRRLGLHRAGYAAIGDAENDLEMLRGADLSGAVANAIPAVRAEVDYRCHRPFDRGVLEFVQGPLRERLDAARPRR
jgi:hydroxymethylpyrimidine pyrophosphatase-like HAD family hydrolase